MLYPRIIPTLLIHKKGLVKTVKFKDAKYVGDPINAVKIFNEKEVDEIVVVDIDASINGNEPDYKLIENLAFECRMPLCYGGGVKTVEQAERILNLGVEKVAVSSVAIENPPTISALAQRVGNQSVVVVLDVKKRMFGNRYDIFTHNGKINTKLNPIEYAVEVEKKGAGEIVINSIDNDGMMNGYDLNIIESIREVINIPLTVLGGAGSLENIGELIKKYGIIGAAAGSLFVFKGKYRAVLINYPTSIEKDTLINSYFLKNC
ncbi:MAG: imidazole glycerol phosphate synthase subunit HisF [Bacteroidetes bacterium]|nr:imidazole glycerol phosphate synthase subunit HisF [Bacteroidota bacterium]